MSRYTGPKHKRSRREGVNLTGTRSPSLERHLRAQANQNRTGRPRRQTEYGRQLREKQKLKRLFGMNEGPFRRTFEAARRSADPAGEALVQLLERRLDNVVYRLGLAPTRPMARQLVNHGHVVVNGRRVDIPSYRTSTGDQIELSARAAQIPAVQEAIQDNIRAIPSWLSRDGNQAKGVVLATPRHEELEIPVDLNLVITFYSR